MRLHQLIVFAFLIFFYSDGIAQGIQWQHTYGGNDNDVPYMIRQTPDGGFICGGLSESDASGDKTENCIGIADFWILKLRPDGTIEWQNTIGGTANDVLFSIEPTSDGGYICGGYSLSGIGGDKTESCLGGYDYWIVKLDAIGNIQWQNTIGGISNDNLHAVYQTADGGYICGGYSESGISGDKTEASQGLSDYWIVKLDPSGSISWQNTIGGSNNDFLYSIFPTSDGGVICGGESNSPVSGDKTESNQSYDFWIVKIDSTGTIQWQNTIGGSMIDELVSIKQTLDGGFICGSSSASPAGPEKTEGCHGWYDMWAVKLDSTGNIQWQNNLGGSHLEKMQSIDQLSDGGYICAGYSSSKICADKNENPVGNENYWFVKLDQNGNKAWQNTIGGDGNDHIFTVCSTTDGGLVAAGLSTSDATFDKTEDCKGGYDFWILKLADNGNTIKGLLYDDVNSNGMHDLGEPGIPNKLVSQPSGGMVAVTQPDGSFAFVVSDTGHYDVYGPLLNYYSILPVFHSANFGSMQQVDSLNDFSMQSLGAFNDLCVNINPTSNFRSGMNAFYTLNYSNPGTTVLSPTVIFYPDDDLTYLYAVPSPTTVTTDSVVWSIGALNPWDVGQIEVTVNVNSGLPIGTLINSGVVIEPLAGDANTQCNQSYWEIFTTGSFDPNDILVSTDTLTTNQVLQGEYLEYLIRFQNTGNDTAFFVDILNPIDTNVLDLQTFEFEAASHQVHINWAFWERNMRFTFENILLPDSGTNESQSHGFVRYRIQPKNTLVAGDSITNFAAIFFDFNDPVITNTARTDVVLPTQISEFTSTSAALNLFPNPSRAQLTITLNSSVTSDTRIEIIDCYGKLQFPVHDGMVPVGIWKKEIDISRLAAGMYFIRSSTHPALVQRFVKY